MAETRVTSTKSIIAGLLRMENGVRKAARIFLFLDRAAAVEILYELPPALIAVITREMAILRAQIQDFEGERRALEQALGAVSAVIDLKPPKLEAAQEFAFMDMLSPNECQSFADRAPLELLSVVVANASPEVAFSMTTALRTRFERKELTDAMTRLSRSDADWSGAAREMAKSVRGSKAIKPKKPNTRVGVGSLTKISVATRKSAPPKVQLAPPEEITEGVADVGEAITTLLDAGGRSLLQKALGSLNDDLLAAALASAQGPEADLLRSNLSRNRLVDISEEAQRLEKDDAFDGAAASRQRQILIGRLLKAAEEAS